MPTSSSRWGWRALALALVLIALPEAAGAQGGTIEGRVQLPSAAPRRTASRYPGAAPSTRTAQEIPAVAYIRGAIAGASAARPANPTLAQQDTAFAPNVLIVPVGTIMSRLARARIALQQRLDAGGGIRRSATNAKA